MAAWADAMIAMMIGTMMIAKTETIGGRFPVEANRGIPTPTFGTQTAIAATA